MKALLIGCGNIGAGYDLERPEKTWTHARAFSKKSFDIEIFDQDQGRAEQIASIYGSKMLANLDASDLSRFDLVSITTPTTTHFEYLKACFEARVPVIICEKPVTPSLTEAEMLLELYNRSRSKVIVNYIRRFQPGYAIARSRISKILEDQKPSGIIIKYKRGFLNNASHAIDLLEFLFDEQFKFENSAFTSADFGTFDFDPTLTGSCNFLGIPVSFAGFSLSGFGIFEIELFFSDEKIVICHSGNDIRYYEQTVKGDLIENTSRRQTGLLDHYMTPVVDFAEQILTDPKTPDNFAGSISLNQRILTILQTIK